MRHPLSSTWGSPYPGLVSPYPGLPPAALSPRSSPRGFHHRVQPRKLQDCSLHLHLLLLCSPPASQKQAAQQQQHECTQGCSHLSLHMGGSLCSRPLWARPVPPPPPPGLSSPVTSSERSFFTCPPTSSRPHLHPLPIRSLVLFSLRYFLPSGSCLPPTRCELGQGQGPCRSCSALYPQHPERCLHRKSARTFCGMNE